MIGVAFVVLVFGALIAAIWGREAAQGCFSKAWQILAWMFAIGMTVAAPVVMVPILAIAAFLFLIVWSIQKGKENKENWVPPPIEPAKKSKKAPSTQPASVPYQQVHSPLQAALANATSKAQRFMPRDHAVTVMPGATPSSEFWSTHVRDAKGSRYVIVEARTNQFIVLSTSEFIKDWVPWMEPAKPHVQTPTKPQWRSASE